MKKKVNHYTDEFKLKVVQEYLETGISREELKKKYGFSGNSGISNQMSLFRQVRNKVAAFYENTAI